MDIRSACLKRIAELFNTEQNNLSGEDVFGVDLIASDESIYKNNAYDELLDDIHFVADRTIMKKVKDMNFQVNTVDDYCCYMELQFSKKPKRVMSLFFS